MCNAMASICIKKYSIKVWFSKKAKDVTFFPDIQIKNDMNRSQTTDVFHCTIMCKLTL